MRRVPKAPSLRSRGDVLRWMARQNVRDLVDHFYDKPPRRQETPRGRLNEDPMSTQRRYKDCLGSAEFQHTLYLPEPGTGGEPGGTSSANLTSRLALSETPHLPGGHLSKG